MTSPKEVGYPYETNHTNRPRIVTPNWLRERRKYVDSLKEARESNPFSTTALLVPAAQHPLLNGETPGFEFSERLEGSLSRYYEIISLGGSAEFFVPGSRHFNPKTQMTDSVALCDAGFKWLVDHGVPALLIHGKDWIDKYRQGQGIYNGAEEIATISLGFQENTKYASAEYFCSPAQTYRALVYSLAWGVPLSIGIPEALWDGHKGESSHDSRLQNLVLNGIASTIDPYGDRLLPKVTRNRIPKDNNIVTSHNL